VLKEEEPAILHQQHIAGFQQQPRTARRVAAIQVIEDVREKH
jgi:hypothetical protein